MIRGVTGTITIVTDNQPYGESLIRALAKTAQLVINNRLTLSKGGSSGSGNSGSGSGNGSGSGSNSKDGVSGGYNGDMAFVSAKVPPTDGASKRTLQESIAVTTSGVDIGKAGKGDGKESGKKGKSTQSASSMDVDMSEEEEDDDEDEDDGHDKRDQKKVTKVTTTTTITSQTEGIDTSKEALHLELWRGDSEEVQGNGARSSSYFDRLWERGQKKRRWFIVLKKL